MEGRSVAVRPIPGTKDIMKNLRILLLATTALTASQLATSESQAQTAPIVMAIRAWLTCSIMRSSLYAPLLIGILQGGTRDSGEKLTKR